MTGLKLAENNLEVLVGVIGSRYKPFVFNIRVTTFMKLFMSGLKLDKELSTVDGATYFTPELLETVLKCWFKTVTSVGETPKFVDRILVVTDNISAILKMLLDITYAVGTEVDFIQFRLKLREARVSRRTMVRFPPNDTILTILHYSEVVKMVLEACSMIKPTLGSIAMSDSNASMMKELMTKMKTDKLDISAKGGVVVKRASMVVSKIERV